MRVMTVSVASGITSISGAPFAGILFSAELCSTVFLISNFWKLFVCGTIVKIWFELGIYYFPNDIKPVSSAEVSSTQVINNIPHYILIGIMCGWMGSLWIYTFSLYLQYKKENKLIIFTK